MSVKMMTALALLCAMSIAACGQTETAQAPEAPAVEAPAPVSAQPAYVGTWATDLAGCAIPQEQQEAPYVFGADGFDQHEAHCTFAMLAETSPGAWHAPSACQVEGDEQSNTIDFTVQGDAMTIAPNTRLIRCPAP